MPSGKARKYHTKQASVLTIFVPPRGTYVLNKQPPNKQIWLSSPLSGPKRFDYVDGEAGVEVGEGVDVNEKAEVDEQTKKGLDIENPTPAEKPPRANKAGNWIYLRDGTSLSDLLREELSVNVDVDVDVGSSP